VAIIPWSECHAHEYENLIALCPNCHRRTDNGETDRKHLCFLYEIEWGGSNDLTIVTRARIALGSVHGYVVFWFLHLFAHRGKNLTDGHLADMISNE